MTEDMFKGLFYSYFKNYSSKHISKLVKITASTTNTVYQAPIILIDPNADSSKLWQSNSFENSSITLTLLRERLLISSYSLKSRTGWNKYTPFEWVLEGSNDQKNWVLIHHKLNGTELIESGSRGNWECTSSIPFNSFKLTQLHENRKNEERYKYMFTLGKIELFGTIFPNGPVTCYQRKRNEIGPHIILFLVINCS